MTGSTHPAVDWFRVITDLERAGATLRAISEAIDAPVMTIHGWKQGAEPRHCDGERLLSLWCEEMHCERQDVPKLTRVAA